MRTIISITRIIPALVVLATVYTCAGCIKVGFEKPVGQSSRPAGPSEQLRANLGTIALVCEAAPQVEMQKAMDRSSAAASGAFGGVFAGSGGHGGGSDAAAGFAALVMWAVSIPVGAVVGAIEGVPGEQIKAADRELRSAAAAMPFSDGLRDELLAQSKKSAAPPLRLPAAAAENPPDAAARYRRIANEGVDTILEVNIITAGLAGPREPNPDLSLLLRVRTRLVRAADGRELHSYTWVRTAGKRKFTEWGTNGASAFKEETQRSLRFLAERIVDEMFLVYRPAGASRK